MKQHFWRAVFLLPLSSIVLACSWERPESSYPSYADAKQGGAIDKGWIPAWLPSSARDIREMHDIDTNESMLAFTYDARQSWDLPDDCKRVDHAQVTPPRFTRTWWPNPNALQQAYVFYRCKGDVPFSSLTAWVARHNSGEHGLHWRAHSR